MKAANIGELRNCHDPSLTYEGDNNVLGQQGSNWLLRQVAGKLESPLGTVGFLADRERILSQYTFDYLKRNQKADLLSFDCEYFLVGQLWTEALIAIISIFSYNIKL